MATENIIVRFDKLDILEKNEHSSDEPYAVYVGFSFTLFSPTSLKSLC